MDAELCHIPIIDNHCHPIPVKRELSPEEFIRIFTQARHPSMLQVHAKNTLYFHYAVRKLSELLSCPPTMGDILKARAVMEPAPYLQKLLKDHGVKAMLMDMGYPPDAPSIGELRAVYPMPLLEIVRLESLMERLMQQGESFSKFTDAFIGELDAARERRAVALKSIAAYRSGLNIVPVAKKAAERAYLALLKAAGGKKVRLESKPIICYMVLVAMEWAAQKGLPVQFHTGIGDPDISLLEANPLQLVPLLKSNTLSKLKIVLLHMGYPYYREACYLASVYPHVYVDMSLTMNFLQEETTGLLSEVLSFTPTSKLLYGSDGVHAPESLWLGLTICRRTLSKLCSSLVQRAVMNEKEALCMARNILCDNASNLYGLALP